MAIWKRRKALVQRRPMSYVTVVFDDAFIKAYGPTEVRFHAPERSASYNGEPVFLSAVTCVIPAPIKRVKQSEEARLIAQIPGREPFSTYQARVGNPGRAFEFALPLDGPLTISALPRPADDVVLRNLRKAHG